jgi:hypothetical protein
VFLASSRTHVDHEAWLVDSSTPFHMTPHMKWFCEYKRYNGGDVFLGDDSIAKIIGCRKVNLNLMDGKIRTLLGVPHILVLAINFISIRKMDDAGAKIVFEKETCRMARGAMVLLKGVQIGTLYKLQGITISDGCNSSIVLDIGAKEEKNPIVSREKAMLWHQRLGHIREKGIRLLNGKGMVNEGMSNFSLDFYFCEHCVYVKYNRVRFPYAAMRVEGILNFVHNDVFRPMLVPQLGKSMYHVSFKDEFLRNTWIYFLKNKSEVFDMFKEFKDLVKNQIEKRIKMLRTDNGRDFDRNEFK